MKEATDKFEGTAVTLGKISEKSSDDCESSVPEINGYRLIACEASTRRVERWSAIDASGRKFWIKIRDIRNYRSWKDDEIFAHEYAMLKDVDIDGVPRYHALFEKDGISYLVTDYVEGVELKSLIDNSYFTDNEECEAILKNALKTLDALSRNKTPIVHSDIKPENIMLDGDKVTFINFGALSAKRPDGTTALNSTGYAPPEVFMGRPDPASDIYALGATIFHFITGRSPNDIERAGDKLVFETLLPKNLSPKLKLCLRRMLVTASDKRASARELSKILDSPSPPKVVRSIGDEKIEFSAGALGVALIFTVTFIGFILQKDYLIMVLFYSIMFAAYVIYRAVKIKMLAK